MQPSDDYIDGVPTGPGFLSAGQVGYRYARVTASLQFSYDRFASHDYYDGVVIHGNFYERMNVFAIGPRVEVDVIPDALFVAASVGDAWGSYKRAGDYGGYRVEVGVGARHPLSAHDALRLDATVSVLRAKADDIVDIGLTSYGGTLGFEHRF